MLPKVGRAAALVCGHIVPSVGRRRLPTLSEIVAGVRYAGRLVLSGEAFASPVWEERINHFHEDERLFRRLPSSAMLRRATRESRWLSSLAQHHPELHARLVSLATELGLDESECSAGAMWLGNYEKPDMGIRVCSFPTASKASLLRVFYGAEEPDSREVKGWSLTRPQLDSDDPLRRLLPANDPWPADIAATATDGYLALLYFHDPDSMIAMVGALRLLPRK